MLTKSFHPPTLLTPRPEKEKTAQAQQLRKDRISALIVLLILAALFGFIIWLATLSPSSVSSLYEYPMP